MALVTKNNVFYNLGNVCNPAIYVLMTIILLVLHVSFNLVYPITTQSKSKIWKWYDREVLLAVAGGAGKNVEDTCHSFSVVFGALITVTSQHTL